jgi:DNA-binding NtrC family response regulator
LEKIPRLARCDVTVLITGETGTGKEMVARAIHYLSRRSTHAFVPVNCGGVPTELFENELFGHVQGAFTGASVTSGGLVQEAEGGTLFLDEVDCLQAVAQTKLLRFLQEGEFRPLGISKAAHADVRFIAATNADLEKEASQHHFRSDLYYRLNVCSLPLPSLRSRQADIVPLACHFLKKYSMRFQLRVLDFDHSAVEKLVSYNWPGNVRELENAVERAVVLSEHETITSSDIIIPHSSSANGGRRAFHDLRHEIIAQFERDYVERKLAENNGNVTRAAAAANENRRSFIRLMRKHGIAAPAHAILEAE